MPKPRRSFLWLGVILLALCVYPAEAAVNWNGFLKVPSLGEYTLRVISPDLLELEHINTKQPDPARVDSWDWIDDGVFITPKATSIKVVVGDQTNNVSALGFKRRPVYAPLFQYDLRIANHLYLRLTNSIAEGQMVRVVNDGSLWPANLEFTAVVDPLRYSPAIHVNQEGYIPAYPKKAMVGYYLGNWGEMQIPSADFSIVRTSDGSEAFEGTLTHRPDTGYTYEPAPYQLVFEADFSALSIPGEYRLVVPGLGGSLPFSIHEGHGLNVARTYALGMFHQRSGFDVAMPFTRFTHAADHTAPALVPATNSAPFEHTWEFIADYASRTNWDNPSQIAQRMTNPAAQLYPYVNPGPVDVSGGHFEAANYSKVAWNGAQIVHILMLAVDAFPGVAALDNMGLPESGDGISDALQEAKWEADCLLKMQDTDGGFYYMVHPRDRKYEFDVLPEHGDTQVLWPKNTATTAASIAALAQCASSPAFKQAYPATASNYWVAVQLGWKFLTNAISMHGKDGAYQKIMHFDDTFTHDDDLAWAACELFLATGEPTYRSLLEEWFPDPTDPATTRWGWWKMHASYGNAIRSYATAVKSGRLEASQLNQEYLAKCITAITNYGKDNLRWSQENAYGTSFPDATKRVRDAGWYFSTEQAFDMVVASEFDPDPAYLDATLLNVNYELGCNPVNVSYVPGLGWRRQREVVDQYSANDRRTLPKIGFPISNIQVGFVNTWTYGYEPAVLTFPSDGLETAPYPFYDRWSDFWNTTTEASTPNIARSYVVGLWLAARSSLAAQPWRSTNATIIAPAASGPGAPVTVTLQVADPNLEGAKITWEARDQEPVFDGLSYTFAPDREGDFWVEAEVHWPDGRRAFAMTSVLISGNTAPQLTNPQRVAGSGFSFGLSGVPSATYRVERSTNLVIWESMGSHELPANGKLTIIDSSSEGPAARYYRAVMAP